MNIYVVHLFLYICCFCGFSDVVVLEGESGAVDGGRFAGAASIFFAVDHASRVRIRRLS